MIYLTGHSGDEVREWRHLPRLGLMAQPISGYDPEISTWGRYAADNGCYAASRRPEGFNETRWRRWIGRIPHDRCLFVCAPDVLHWKTIDGGETCIGDAAATLAQAERFLPMIRAEGFPAALVLQDGMTDTTIPWGEFDALFIGGSTEWKIGVDAHRITIAAVERGIPVHMGRVNTWGRLRIAGSWGCSSADGTLLRYGPEVLLPRLLRWIGRFDDGTQLAFPPC